MPALLIEFEVRNSSLCAQPSRRPDGNPICNEATEEERRYIDKSETWVSLDTEEVTANH